MINHTETVADLWFLEVTTSIHPVLNLKTHWVQQLHITEVIVEAAALQLYNRIIWCLASARKHRSVWVREDGFALLTIISSVSEWDCFHLGITMHEATHKHRWTQLKQQIINEWNRSILTNSFTKRAWIPEYYFSVCFRLRAAEEPLQTCHHSDC